MNLATDLRYPLRRLLQAPGFSLAVLTMLALGIALSAAMIGVLRGVLGSLPLPQAEQVVVVESANAELGVANGALTPAEAQSLAETGGPFARFGYYSWSVMTLHHEQRPRQLKTVQVSAGFFDTLGVHAQLGRWFDQGEFTSGGDAVVLSHHEWQRLFGGDPSAVGRTLETADGRLQVVGVMPADFAVPSAAVGAWRPLPVGSYPPDQPTSWAARFVYAVARLDPAIGETAIAQRLDALSVALAERFRLPVGQWQLRVRPMLELIVGDLRGVLWSAFAVALLVLLIACANVAILVDARQVARRHEHAVVQALGATRQRLFRGMLLEIGLLTGLAVMLGTGLALLGIEGLRELARGSLPRVDAITVDAAVLAIAAALGLLVPLVAAMAGALRPLGKPSEAMRSGGRGLVGGARRRGWLPTLGVALSTISLVAGSALLFSLWRLQAVDPGLRHEQVYGMQVFQFGDADTLRDFSARLRERLGALPGVEQVAVSSALPLVADGGFDVDLELAERAEAEPAAAALRQVSPEFSSLLAIPIIAGRSIDADDRAGGERVAVINRELARRLFGSSEALGRSVGVPVNHGPPVPHRIVGISENTRNRGLRTEPGPEIWVPFAAEPSVGMLFLVATRTPLAGVERLFADALFEVDPAQATTRIFTLGEDIADQLAPARFFARTVGAFALAALLLAAFGVYAVATLRQQQRVAEFGLRLAVGAHPRSLVLQMLGDSARGVITGIALGLAGAWMVLQLLQTQLFGMQGAEPSVVASGVGLLLFAALLAALLPALRVARIDPMRALRQD